MGVGRALEDESGSLVPFWLYYTYEVSGPRPSVRPHIKRIIILFQTVAIKGSNPEILPALEVGLPTGKIPGALLSTSNPKRQVLLTSHALSHTKGGVNSK